MSSRIDTIRTIRIIRAVRTRPRVVRLLVALVALVATMSVVIVGSPDAGDPAFASPYDLTAANDPRVPANCPGGFGSNGIGGTTWCRVHGVHIGVAAIGQTRWAGQYAFIQDLGNGAGPKVLYAWCLDDSGSHPRVAYGPGDITDGRTLAESLHGPLAHPEGAEVLPLVMGLINDGQGGSQIVPGFVTTFTPDELSAGVWAIQHYVVGDRTGSGSVVVPDLARWASGTGAARLNQVALELWAYGLSTSNLTFVASAGPTDPSGRSSIFIDASVTGGPVDASAMHAIIDQATNLAWATSGQPIVGPIGLDPNAPLPDVTVARGRITLDVRLIDPAAVGGVHVYRAYTTSSSWQGVLARGGQQSTGVYFAPANVTFHADASVAVAPRMNVRVVKSSADPYFSPAGATFELVDNGGAGGVIGTAVTDVNGVADFAGIDPTVVTPPLVLRESIAPAGLSPAADVVLPWPLSTDPANPTVVPVVDSVKNEQMIIRKVLSDPSVGPGDLSGFEFSVVRDDGTDFGTHATIVNGFTDRIPATAGRFTVCEVAKPAWALPLTNGPCLKIVVAPNGSASVEVVYTNVVPIVECTTTLRDVADGDQILATTGGSLVDHVRCTGLVPGTTYTVAGELQRRNDDGTVTPSGITGSATVVASASDMTIDVSYTVPDGHACSVFVAFETVSIGARVIAEHADATDENQTAYVPRIRTSARTDHGGRLANPGDTMTDRVEYCGYPEGAYEMRVVWQNATVAVRQGTAAVPTCSATTLVATIAHTVVTGAPSGTVDLPGVAVPADGPGRFVAFESSTKIDVTPAAAVAEHRDCSDERQTIWRPTIVTERAEIDPIGPGVNHDLFTVADLPPRAVLGDRTVSARGGLHRHDSSTPVGERECATANQVASFVVRVAGDGQYTSPGEAHEPSWTYSYQERLVVEPGPTTPPTGGPDELTGTTSGVWESTLHGCRVASQTFVSRAVAQQPTVAPGATPTIVTQPSVVQPSVVQPSPVKLTGNLPRTGLDSQFALGLACVLVGSGMALVVAARARARSRRIATRA